MQPEQFRDALTRFVDTRDSVGDLALRGGVPLAEAKHAEWEAADALHYLAVEFLAESLPAHQHDHQPSMICGVDVCAGCGNHEGVSACPHCGWSWHIFVGEDIGDAPGDASVRIRGHYIDGVLVIDSIDRTVVPPSAGSAPA